MNNINITKEDMAKVAERHEAINSAHDTNLSLNDNLKAAYLKAHPEATAEQAGDVVSKLMTGCEELTRKYNEALKESFNAEAEISELTKEMTLEARFNFLINAFAVVQSLNASTFDSQTDLKESVEKAVKELASATPNPTEEDCATIQKLLIEAMSNSTIILSGAEKAKDLLQAAKDSATVIDFASEQYDGARLKAEMALAMWLEYEAGNLPSIGAGVTPEVIAISAATAVEEAKIMNDVANRSTTLDKAVRCLKILGFVTLYLFFTFCLVSVSTVAVCLMADALFSVLGTSFIACVAICGILLPVICWLSDLNCKAVSVIMEKVCNAFEEVGEKLRESVFPKVKEVASTFIAWVRGKLPSLIKPTDPTVVTSVKMA